MRLLNIRRYLAVPAVTAFAAGLAVAPSSYADPNDGGPGVPAPAPAPAQVVDQPVVATQPPVNAEAGAAPLEVPAGDSDAAVMACSKMSNAMAYAATNYSDFANEMSVAEGDYNNAIAANTNVVGRTALRQAAEVANDAANTPGWPLSWPPHACVVRRRVQAGGPDGSAHRAGLGQRQGRRSQQGCQ